jgi:hypothetical protein
LTYFFTTFRLKVEQNQLVAASAKRHLAGNSPGVTDMAVPLARRRIVIATRRLRGG